MSLLTQAHLLDKYGPRLNAEQTAEALGITVKALMIARSNPVAPPPLPPGAGSGTMEAGR